MEIVDLTSIYGSRPYPERPEEWIRYYVAHHAESREPDSLDDAIALIEEIDEFHRLTRKWPGISYSRAALENWYFLLRPRSRNGYHTGAGGDTNGNGIGDANDFGLACVLLGTFTYKRPSTRTLQTLAEGKAWEEAQLGRTLLLRGHQDFMPTACPGEGWQQWRHDVVVPGEVVEPYTPLLVEPVPADYQRKFGVGPQDWPGVAANLEGVIQTVMRHADDRQDKLSRIAQIVNN